MGPMRFFMLFLVFSKLATPATPFIACRCGPRRTGRCDSCCRRQFRHYHRLVLHHSGPLDYANLKTSHVHSISSMFRGEWPPISRAFFRELGTISGDRWDPSML